MKLWVTIVTSLFFHFGLKADIKVQKDIVYATVNSNKIIRSILADADIHLNSSLWDIEVNKKLKLDIYREDRLQTNRPLVIFLHGGAFVIGDKQDDSVKYLCKKIATEGYVTASIEYRKLGFGYLSLPKAGYAAMQDARAAIRYLRANSEKYSIDPNQIFIGGISAGGFTALNVAYYDEGEPLPISDDQIENIFDCLDCVGDHRNVSAQVNGVINIVGGVYSLSMLDNNIPTICFHGDKDNIVNPDYDYPFQPLSDLYNSSIDLLIEWLDKIIDVELMKEKLSIFLDHRKTPRIYGSYSIHESLKSKGSLGKLYRFKKSGHKLVSDDGKLLKSSKHVVAGIQDFLNRYARLSN